MRTTATQRHAAAARTSDVINIDIYILFILALTVPYPLYHTVIARLTLLYVYLRGRVPTHGFSLSCLAVSLTRASTCRALKINDGCTRLYVFTNIIYIYSTAAEVYNVSCVTKHRSCILYLQERGKQTWYTKTTTM